ncbi:MULTISPECIES: TonB-dependent receptor [unclassified Duganella]|jgi:iron complex outermembrane receptor protein|uniref:TonB-dependent receptor n=1 Tax=unclassified Duganella TaxID=2636909 RepID=UPI00089020F5|nr:MULTISPECIES: TonB-dependent receptor [unclassified Duganella]SDH44201.1 TonB-dependent receptor [Duganella sp. OV458]SDK58303.1 TonB-dependent receptor [Duganella sp. OV510]
MAIPRKTVLAVLIADLLIAVSAQAQTTANTADADAGPTVVVSGIRASLSSSLNTKRLQEGVVDAVSAEDAGKFPDTNIAESLQRVTGVQIQRNGGEGRYISVRGLGPEFNNVLVNGRTLTSDTGGREFSFDLLSSDLISKALVYKTSQPFLPEGGIGSTVDIQTARPLSGKTGHSTVINASGSYDNNSEKKTPNISGMYTFANEERNFGVNASLSYTDRASKQNKAVTDAWNYRDVSVINGDLNSRGLTMADVTTKKLYIPQSYGFQQEDETRKRLVGNLTVQYNPSSTWKLTADALYSHLDQRNDIIAVSDWINPQVLGAQINGSNQITSLLRPGSTFYANNPELAGSGKLLGEANSNDMIVKGGDRKSITRAFGLNSKWALSPEWKLEGDVNTSRTSSGSPDMWVVAGMVPKNGDVLTFNGTPSIVFGDGIADPTAVRAHAVSNGDVQRTDKISEGRMNLAWNHEIGYFKGLQTGLGYSQREVKRTQWSSDSWNTYSGYHLALPSSLFTVTPLDNFLGGGAQVPSAYLRFDPYAYMDYLNQRSTLLSSNDPAHYLDTTLFPNGPMAIDYTKPSMSGVKEKVSSIFLDSKWEGEGWSANAGVRMVHVKSSSVGTSRVLQSATKSPNDTTYILVYGPMSTNTVSNDYNSVLPSANLKFDLTPDMMLRLAASKTETRPTLSQMGIDNSYGGRYGDVQTGGGNPYLKPMKSNNLDLSWEWYLSKTNYVSAAVFQKNVRDFLETRLVDTTLPQYPGEVVHDTRVRNGQKGKIKGVEIAGQYAFDEAVSWLKGFGVAANYTYVDATASREVDSGTPNCGYPGLSPQSYNGSVFYENSKFQARVSYNWRNHFSVDCGGGSTQPRNRSAYGQTDASLRYNITPTVALYLDAINLTNSRTREYALNESQFLTLEDVGRRVNVGLRAAF